MCLLELFELMVRSLTQEIHEYNVASGKTMDELDDSIHTQIEHYSSEMKFLRQATRKCIATKDTFMARFHTRRFITLKRQKEKLWLKWQSLTNLRSKCQEAKLTKSIFQVLVGLKDTLTNENNEIKKLKPDELVDQIDEQIQLANEINDILAAPLGELQPIPENDADIELTLKKWDAQDALKLRPQQQQQQQSLELSYVADSLPFVRTPIGIESLDSLV